MPVRGPAAGRAAGSGLARALVALLWLEPFWVALLALPLTFPARWLSIRDTPTLIFLLFAFWPLRLLLGWMRRRSPGEAKTNPLAAPILLLLATTPVSLLITDQPRAGWLLLAYLAVGVAACLALINWPLTRRWPALIVAGMAALGVGLALLGPVIAQGAQWRIDAVPAWQAPLARWTRTLGETVNANILAGGLVLVPPMLVGWLLGLWAAPAGRWAWAGRVMASAAVLALVGWMGSVLWRTESRGAWLGTVAALGTLLVVRWRWLRWLALAFGVALAVWFVAVGPVTALSPIMQGGMARDYNGRMEIWARSVGLLARHPLTGIGLGAFEAAIVEDAPQIRVPITPGLPHAHNLWLQIGLDLGLVGLFAYTWLLAAAGVRFYHAWRYRAMHAYGGLALAGLGSLVALVIHGLVDAPLWSSKLAFLPWLVFALAALLPSAPTPAPAAATRVAHPGTDAS